MGTISQNVARGFERIYRLITESYPITDAQEQSVLDTVKVAYEDRWEHIRAAYMQLRNTRRERHCSIMALKEYTPYAVDHLPPIADARKQLTDLIKTDGYFEELPLALRIFETRTHNQENRNPDIPHARWVDTYELACTGKPREDLKAFLGTYATPCEETPHPIQQLALRILANNRNFEAAYNYQYRS